MQLKFKENYYVSIQKVIFRITLLALIIVTSGSNAQRQR